MVFHLSEQLIQRYLDHQLTGQEEQKFRQHLINCQSCQQELKQYQEIYHLLQQEPDFLLSPEFDREVLSRLNRRKRISYSPIQYDLLLAFLGFISAFCFIVCLYDFHSITQTLSGVLSSLNNLWNMSKAAFTAISSLFTSYYVMTTLIILNVLSFFEEQILRKQNKSFLL